VLLSDKQRERVSYERDVAILDAQIEKARLSIRARDIVIQKLGQDINGKEEVIGGLNEKLGREKQSLAQLLRKTNEIDNISLVEVVMGNQNLSDFFEDLDSFDSIKIALQGSFVEIANTKDMTQSQKRVLQGKQEEEFELRDIQRQQKMKIEKQEADKQAIVDATKGVEAEYQKLIKAKEKSAAQIRTELFTLRGSAAIPFEQALELANIASAKTDVRPAFILGVIAEESNLGENVGTGTWKIDLYQCYQSIGYITAAEKQKAAFLKITSDLGLNPDTLPVSRKPWYGCGGAMGPAQFMPTTWALYVDRIAKATGHNPPSPWDNGDAFMASAILLMDNGADKGTAYSERLAALRYLAGWKNAEKSSYAFYGDDVMALTAKYQKLIDILQNS
ncbi:MAG TPA: lytic murein transglycosylase, partial [Candidatus Paceibacterota bacterium]|nr:lytic murein transglycosylase [Candidatus Paceibacterota bacterium]